MKTISRAVVLTGLSVLPNPGFGQVVAPPPAAAVDAGLATQQYIPSTLGGTVSTEGSGRGVAIDSFKNGGPHIETSIPYSVGLPTNQ